MQQRSLALPDPRAFDIASRNAARVAQRRAFAALAEEAGRVGQQQLRRGGVRPVGGTFEELEVEPGPRRIQTGLGQNDLERLLEAFQFDPRSEVLARSSSLTAGARSSFSPETISRLTAMSGRVQTFDIFGQPSRLRVGAPGLFGGVRIRY